MSYYQFAFYLTINTICGIGFAYYLMVIYPNVKKSSWTNHLWQWLPILGGFLSAHFSGMQMREDTLFAFYGVSGALLALCGAGYVFGRKLFKNVVYVVPQVTDKKKTFLEKIKEKKAAKAKEPPTIDDIPIRHNPITTTNVFPQINVKEEKEHREFLKS